MSFFEPADPPPPPQAGQTERQPWLFPEPDELGVVVVIERDVARTADALVSLRKLVVHSDGFRLVTEGRRRGLDQNEWLHLQMVNRFMGDVTADYLRLGVEFADGSKATNLEPLPYERPPEPPVLSYDWVWPLPPSGPLAVVCEWPAVEIPVTRLELDASLILGAVPGVRSIWD